MLVFGNTRYEVSFLHFVFEEVFVILNLSVAVWAVVMFGSTISTFRSTGALSGGESTETIPTCRKTSTSVGGFLFV
jgi:hypothetical protein